MAVDWAAPTLLETLFDQGCLDKIVSHFFPSAALSISPGLVRECGPCDLRAYVPLLVFKIATSLR